MTKFPLLVLGILAFVGLLAVPAHAAIAPQGVPAPFLCSTSSSPAAPTVGAPAPKPMLFNLNCGTCSDFLCNGKRAGDTCGAGPAYFGYRCLNDSTCPSDGLQHCSCQIA